MGGLDTTLRRPCVAWPNRNTRAPPRRYEAQAFFAASLLPHCRPSFSRVDIHCSRDSRRKAIRFPKRQKGIGWVCLTRLLERVREYRLDGLRPSRSAASESERSSFDWLDTSLLRFRRRLPLVGCFPPLPTAHCSGLRQLPRCLPC